LVLSLLLAYLQEADAQVKNNNTGKKITFVCASWTPINDDIYYVKGGTEKEPEYEKISISEMVRSLPAIATEGSIVKFYRPNSETSYSQVAQVRIPVGSKRYLLLFLPKNGVSYSVRAIPDERKHSPFGAYCFYNLSKLPVNGVLAKTKFDVPAGKQKLVALNLQFGTPIPYATQIVIDGKRQWLQRNTFHFNPKKHAKFFIYPVSTTNGRYKVKSKAIVEFKEDPTPTDN